MVPASDSTAPRPKALVCITEDWFALSHFQPLLRTLGGLAREVVVATRPSGREAELSALGTRVVPFDFQRASLNPVEQAFTVRRIADLIRREAPDVVHVIAMQPMVLASLALSLVRPRPAIVLHLTGLGFLGISEGMAARAIRPFAMRALRSALAHPRSWLIAENPEDLAYLGGYGADPGPRHAIVAGAGVDPQEFPALTPPDAPVPTAAFVGRMIRSKGVPVLIEAYRMLRARGVPVGLALYGRADTDNPDALDAAWLAATCKQAGIAWNGHVSDVRTVWRNAAISVLPAITREGLPRAVLEAAASARPSIVTDVPGCRHVVRHEVDGLVVPPGDAAALAAAIERLTGDAALRARLGAAARQHVLDHFTTDRVAAGIRNSYASLLALRAEAR